MGTRGAGLTEAVAVPSLLAVVTADDTFLRKFSKAGGADALDPVLSRTAAVFVAGLEEDKQELPGHNVRPTTQRASV